MGSQLENCCLTDDAVLWPAQEAPSNYGETRVGQAEEMTKGTRWERVVAETGKPNETTKPKTITVDVDREVKVGSLIWKGSLVDLEQLPGQPDNLFKVVSYNEVPDIKGRNFQRSVQVVSCADRIPVGYGT